MTTTRKPAAIEQLPASELRALRDRIEGWRRVMSAVLEDIETVYEHYSDAGVQKTQRGGWNTVRNLLPDIELLDTLINGGGEIWYAYEPGPDGLEQSPAIADALGVVSAAFIAQRQAEGGPANARLIAAAPDLREALMGMLELFSAVYTGTEAGIPQIEQARAAIAKAEGGAA